MKNLKKKYLSALQEMNESINLTLNLEEISNLVVEKVAKVLGVKGCRIFITETETIGLKVAASYGIGQDFFNECCICFKKNISENLNTDEALIKDDNDADCIRYTQAGQEEGVGSILSLPISRNGKVNAKLHVYGNDGYVFSKEIITFVKAVCVQVACAIQNACEYKIAEGRHEIMMTDVWKWFKVRCDFNITRESACQPLYAQNWQRRL
jgi:GAF domain-containing protein